MASVTREIELDAPLAEVWAALRDFRAPHQPLAPGFLLAAALQDDGSRVVTFFDGSTAREILVGVDDARHRLAYSVIESGGKLRHHNASAQVFPITRDRSRLVWITDVLPDDMATRIGTMMDHAVPWIQEHFEGQTRRQRPGQPTPRVVR